MSLACLGEGSCLNIAVKDWSSDGEHVWFSVHSPVWSVTLSCHAVKCPCLQQGWLWLVEKKAWSNVFWYPTYDAQDHSRYIAQFSCWFVSHVLHQSWPLAWPTTYLSQLMEYNNLNTYYPIGCLTEHKSGHLMCGFFGWEKPEGTLLRHVSSRQGRFSVTAPTKAHLPLNHLWPSWVNYVSHLVSQLLCLLYAWDLFIICFSNVLFY